MKMIRMPFINLGVTRFGMAETELIIRSAADAIKICASGGHSRNNQYACCTSESSNESGFFGSMLG